MKKIKFIIVALILIIIFRQIITYTVPVKIGSFPEHYSYIITNPYNDNQLPADSKIEDLILYLENNKFVRRSEPYYTYDSTKTIRVDFNPKSEPFAPIHLYFLVYHSDRSCLDFGSNFYKFDNDDIEFLKQFLGLHK